MPKTKTSAQLAKKAENERLAAERLAKLQADQKLVQELRAKGYVGSDYSILTQLQEEQKAARLAEKEAELQRLKDAKAALERKYVEEAIDGPSAEKIRHFLRGKPATYAVVEKFFRLSGLPRVESDICKS